MKLGGAAILVGSLALLAFSVLVGPSLEGEHGSFILWELRVPRVLVGALVGGTLGLVGACFQTLFANPLATESTVGTTAGATLGALRAADYVLSPLQAEPVALKTLPQLLALLGALRAEGVDIELAAIVLCMLQQRNSDSLAVAEEVWARMPRELVVETTIPRDPTVLAASAAGVPLGLLSRLRPPPLALVFDQLAMELAPRLGLTGEGDDGPVGLFA